MPETAPMMIMGTKFVIYLPDTSHPEKNSRAPNMQSRGSRAQNLLPVETNPLNPAAAVKISIAKNIPEHIYLYRV